MTPTATNPPDDRTYLVYKAVSPSGKVYVGITSQTLDTRVLWHFRAAQVSKSGGRRNYFHNALWKYGDKIQWEILEQVAGRLAANERERHFIKVFQSNDPLQGYNGTDGGDANARPNAAVRQKMSASAKAISKAVCRSGGVVLPILSAAEALRPTPAQISYSIRKGTPRMGFTFTTALVPGNAA